MRTLLLKCLYFSLLILLLVPNIFAQRNKKVSVFEEGAGSFTSYFQPIRQSALKQYEKKYNKLHRKEGVEFQNLLLQGTAFTRSLHKTGIINLNSVATAYLNDLKSHILKDYPAADKSIDVYITFNPALNAMATINEKVYVNVGLLARVKNEAQLAFIMAHELMHIINMHSVEQYKEIKREIGNVGQSNVSRKADQIELFKHTMSVKHELEADSDGFHLYLNAGYNAQDAYEALKILKSADDELIQKQISAKILRISEGRYNDLLAVIKKGKIEDVEAKKEKKKDKKKDDDDENKDSKEQKEELSTHPEIDDRLDKIEELIQNYNTKSTSEFIINQKLFEDIKSESLDIVNNSYNKTSDFGSAFMIYSSLILEGNTSDDNFEQLAYSLFGIIHDRKFNYSYELNKYMSHEDSVFVSFYRQSTLSELTVWSLSVLDSLKTNRTAVIFDKYGTKILELVKGDERITQDEISNHPLYENVKAYAYSGLRFSDIDFKFSFYTGISNRQKRDFNKQKILAKKKKGKIAFLDMNNISVKISSTFAEMNYKKSDKLDYIAQNALVELEENYRQDLALLIPNSIKYKGSQYTDFQLLGKWLSERLYFDGAPYQSLYDKEMKEFKDRLDVRYVMVNLTLEIQNKGSLSIGRLAGIFLNPLYVPQAFTNRQMAKSREYILTIIIDVENGELVMYDKRSTEEPMNAAFVYNIYDDVLKSFINYTK